MNAQAAAGPIVMALVLGACAMMPATTANAPGPARPECAAYEATVYFERDQVSLPTSATPILRETADRIGACSNAGGAVQRITVTSYADSTAVDAAWSASFDLPPMSKADARARALVVRKGLIEVGAPRRTIRIVEAPQQPELLQRRTIIAVEMQ